ncbi:MAG: TonB-dependent receptor domain-containing protein [Rhodoblastus sp.]|uniref:TonB-dependent receptor domain-containing protein n=1 Tax=Rhodoblastus sp. TaxID=1962975 RepID=UPI003F95D1E0
MRIPRALLLGGSLVALLGANAGAIGQTALPEVVVKQAKPAAPVKTAAARKTAPRPKVRQAVHQPVRSVRPVAPPAAPSESPEAAAAKAFAAKTEQLNQTREHILPRVGANSTDLDQATIAALPQGDNTPIEKVLLQTPGFSQDSAASGALHLRNEHANVQYRINGVLLPDGVSGFGQVLDSGLIGNAAVIDGALPAQFGLHTAGVVDITTKNGAFDGGGKIGLYGGSLANFTPSLEYGGTFGQTQYFVTARFLSSDIGIENPAPSYDPIHDHTDQGKFFGYASTLLGDGGRLTFMSGTAVGNYQIPNNPGQPQVYPLPGYGNYTSSMINEHQLEQNYFNIGAFQQTIGNIDYQIAAFSRYSSLNYYPDPIGDLIYNGVASNVSRSSCLNGLTEDTAIRVNNEHTVRTGFYASGEFAQTFNSSVVFPVDANGNVTGAPFTAPTDQTAKTGWLLGVYVQDEWKINRQFTINAGLRFDQMYEYVDANQISPRFSMIYRPFDDTAIHAGYARYFTPPEMALSAPTNLAIYQGTSQQPSVNLDTAVQPERSNVYDIGVDQKFGAHWSAGLDAYYKTATDLLDDGQFGQAYTLTAFNYAQGWNDGLEGKVKYQDGNLQAYVNLAVGRQMATQFVSNQYLIDAATYTYAQTHWIPTDHSQTWTGSAGASYLWWGTRFSMDMIYGSGLRNGFANLTTVPPYTQFNVGLSHDFKLLDDASKPTTLRFDVVNLFDTIYQIRSGSGIGVFAPQYGPRIGFFLGISQKL